MLVCLIFHVLCIRNAGAPVWLVLAASSGMDSTQWCSAGRGAGLEGPSQLLLWGEQPAARSWQGPGLAELFPRDQV